MLTATKPRVALEAERPKPQRGVEEKWPAATIDRRSPVPYYYQLQEILKQEIEDGRWGAMELLPSEAELATSLGISRTVIRKALDILEADGQIVRVKGKGTVVAPPKFRYEAVAAARQWLRHDIEKSASLWRLIHISVVRAGHQLSRVLRLSDDQELWEIVFASSVGGTPISLSQLYLWSDASPQLRTLFARGELPRLVPGEADVLHQLSERFGVSFRNSDLTVESTLANQFEADVLRLRKGTPMFLLSERDTGAHGQPLAFSRTVVRSDHFRFSVTIRRGPRHPEFTDPLVQREIRDR